MSLAPSAFFSCRLCIAAYRLRWWFIRFRVSSLPVFFFFFFLIIRPPQISPLFPTTPLFQSGTKKDRRTAIRYIPFALLLLVEVFLGASQLILKLAAHPNTAGPAGHNNFRAPPRAAPAA